MANSEWRRPLSFNENLTRLPDAFDRGVSVHAHDVGDVLRSAQGLSFTTVGSGASYSVAVFLSRLLESHFGLPATAKNPYDYYLSPKRPGGTVLVSASGNNKDIVACLDVSLAYELKPLVVVTSNPNGQLLKHASDYAGLSPLIIREAHSKEREGFFGVQSVLEAIGAFVSIVPELRAKLGASAKDWCRDICIEAEADLHRKAGLVSRVAAADHVVGLATGWALPCLHDFESKFVEGGLGWLEVAEGKNFTHGRFVNSFRREHKTAIIFFATGESTSVLDMLEEGYGQIFPFLPIISTYEGGLGGIELFIRMFHLFSLLAKHRNVNISRPPVPEEARKLFKGESLYPHLALRDKLRDYVEKTVGEKTAALREDPNPESDRDKYGVSKAVAAASISFLYSEHFVGLLCDYDGTLVELKAPDDGLRDDLVQSLERLLEADIPIAIVTGRGRSAVNSLRETISLPLQKNIYCYLYNGGALWRLSEEKPRWVRKLKNIEGILEALSTAAEIKSLASHVETASLKCQVTLHLLNIDEAPRATAIVRDIVKRVHGQAYSVKTSGRSVDVFPSNVSKVKALADFKGQILRQPRGAPVLIIGDRGDKDGNDFELLQEPYSFSVDELHWKSSTCFPVFNIEGQRLFGPTATSRILKHTRTIDNKFALIY